MSERDSHWRDHVLFYECFQGDNGAGLGASHQTGWTGIIAQVLQIDTSLDAKTFLEDQPLYKVLASRATEFAGAQVKGQKFPGS